MSPTARKATPIERKRLTRFRAKMKQGDSPFGLAVILDRQNTRYLTGFTGTYSALLITPHEAIFYTDSRYSEAAEKMVAPLGYEIAVKGSVSLPDLVAKLCKGSKPKVIGMEGSTTLDEYFEL